MPRTPGKIRKTNLVDFLEIRIGDQSIARTAVQCGRLINILRIEFEPMNVGERKFADAPVHRHRFGMVAYKICSIRKLKNRPEEMKAGLENTPPDLREGPAQIGIVVLLLQCE